MHRKIISLVFIIIVINSGVFGQSISGVPYNKYNIFDTDGIKPGEYQQRRSAVLAKMEPHSLAIFRANDGARRSKDVEYPFRQNSDFLYLTGSNESNCTLVLIPDGYIMEDGAKVYELFFTPPRTKSWHGENLGKEGAQEILGFGTAGTQSAVLLNEQLRDVLASLFPVKRVVYYTPALVESLLDPVSNISFISWREAMKSLQEKYANLEIRGAGILLGDLRIKKSAAEIALLQKAVDITILGQIEAIKSCEPGMFEYQLQAVMEYCFLRAGAESPAFTSIAASGPNTQLFHYDSNRRKMQKGELVVLDAGAEYRGYAGDITRTIPVNGKFSPAQKELYTLVLEAQHQIIDTMYPGMSMAEIEEKGMSVIAKGLMNLGITKNPEDAKRYCSHGMSHSIGADVHEGGKPGTLAEGMVFAIEPGVYIPEGSDCPEKYWNIGIRIEDVVVVTEEGRSMLSAFSPRSIDDIETLMRKKGIGNQGIGAE